MASLQTLHVLVVDSDRLTCEATTETVEALGHRATGETESARALKVFFANPYDFDLAIIEPVMPETTGLDVAIALRRIRPGFPVLFYGGYFDDTFRRKTATIRVGAIACKPLVSWELGKEIDVALALAPKTVIH